jgi:hypothetical protein
MEGLAGWPTVFARPLSWPLLIEGVALVIFT